MTSAKELYRIFAFGTNLKNIDLGRNFCTGETNLRSRGSSYLRQHSHIFRLNLNSFPKVRFVLRKSLLNSNTPHSAYTKLRIKSPNYLGLECSVITAEIGKDILVTVYGSPVKRQGSRIF
jgi:hypothetical protein